MKKQPTYRGWNRSRRILSDGEFFVVFMIALIGGCAALLLCVRWLVN